jgi:Spy/CpxP family protein refolding chaperone
MKRWMFWLLYLSIALNAFFVGAYMANWLSMQSGSERSRTPDMPYKALGLSGEQRSAFEAERDRFHSQLTKAHQTIQSKQTELIDLLSMEKPDRAFITSKQQEILSLQDKLQNEVISHIVDVGTLLRREQRDKFFFLLKKHMNQKMTEYPIGCY